MDKFKIADAAAPTITAEAIQKVMNCSIEDAQYALAENMKEIADSEIYMNDKYQVIVREVKSGWGPMIYLSVKRLDRETVHDWRELQQIKNELVGPENEGVEIFPAESRLVDTANQYHMWVIKDPEARLPFGFNEGRIVTDEKFCNTKQRKFDEGEG